MLQNTYESIRDYDESIYTHDEKITKSFYIDSYTNLLFIPLTGSSFMPLTPVGMTIEDPEFIRTVKKAYKSKELCFFQYVEDYRPSLDINTLEMMVVEKCGCVGYIDELNVNDSGTVDIAVILIKEGTLRRLHRSYSYLRALVDIHSYQHIHYTDEEVEFEHQLNNKYAEAISHLAEESRNAIAEMLDLYPHGSVGQLHFMIQNSPLSTEERYNLLLEKDLQKRRQIFYEILLRELERIKLLSEVHQKTMADIGRQQRDEFLRAQIRHLKEELGETESNEIEDLLMRAEKKEWGADVDAKFEKELQKLQRFNPTTPDYAVQYSYLDVLLNLPWDHIEEQDFTLDHVQEVLDRDHYGLEKVKERIIEQMAVMKLRGDTKAPIICLYGPPGVGKTSLGKSVAEALGRQYVRVALGGLHDEAEIRGHRRTYLGSMPGRIIAALEKCGTNNPVMVLDEIDKIGADYKGDPQQALLEVLDPEQNCHFHDNYIDVDYDLSKVLFIATANTLQTISAPLLDRMELIEISGYNDTEKVEIAKRHLIPKNLVEHGFASDEMTFTDDAIMEIIHSYTRESGVRRLEKQICKVLRKQACLKAAEKEMPHEVDEELVKKYLGLPVAFSDQYENNDIPGIVTGLAWTQAGGEILFIESSVAPGKEGKLTLTGNLGDVMKESAVLALQYIKANHDKIGIPESALEFGTVHVHVPEGAVPKDGPSAGVTIVTSLASTFTGRKVRSHLAMTGEITLRGKVLPVGGIKEKILAAKRAGIRHILLCEKNRKDIEEIKPEYIAGLDFKYVSTIDEVLDYALLPAGVP